MKRLTLLISTVVVFACLSTPPAMAQSSKGVNARDSYSYSASMRAVINGDTKDVNARNMYGHTALMYAAMQGDTKVVESLIDKGADVNARDYKRDWTALMYAARSGKTEAAKLLIDKGADVNGNAWTTVTPLFLAELHGHTDVANLLIKHGADKKYYEKKDRNGYPMLMAFASDKNLTEFKFLIAKGAKVNARDRDGSTALMHAAAGDQPKVVKVLITKGADVNAKNKSGLTALMYAASNDNMDIARALVKSGADVNYKTTVNIDRSFKVTKKAKILVKNKGGGLTATDLARVYGNEYTARVIEETYNKVQAKKQKSATEQVKKAMAKK